jgi:hypothetical protein
MSNTEVNIAMRFRLGGRDHISGDPNCPGCESIRGEHRPKQHRDYGSTSCLGLVHAERFECPIGNASQIAYVCDVCYMNPE